MPHPTLALILLLAGTPLAAQGAAPAVLAAYEKRETKVLAEAGQRHLRLGSWCRKAGLVPQATAQFLTALEVSDGHNPGAKWLVNLMRQLDDRFWRGVTKKPSKALLRNYDQRARKLIQRDRTDRFGLAALAVKLKLDDKALDAYRRLLRASDGPLRFDKQGRIPLEGGSIPVAFAERFRAEAVRINGELRLRCDFLADVPEVGEIWEHEDGGLRVRTEVSAAQAVELHELGSALLPLLATALQGSPTRPLELFVFADRKSFVAYLEKLERPTAHAHGIADYASFVAVTFAGGQSAAELWAVCLHELTHLFDHGLAPAVMPSWYVEGLAESFGGIGTYTWKDGELTVGGLLADHRLAGLRDGTARMALPDLLRTDAWDLLARDRAEAAAFYAQSWAFLRYLRTGAGDEVRATLGAWEARCRGGALGAVPGKARSRDARDAAAAFDEMFAGQLPQLEAGFAAWLREL